VRHHVPSFTTPLAKLAVVSNGSKVPTSSRYRLQLSLQARTTLVGVPTRPATDDFDALPRPDEQITAQPGNLFLQSALCGLDQFNLCACHSIPVSCAHPAYEPVGVEGVTQAPDRHARALIIIRVTITNICRCLSQLDCYDDIVMCCCCGGERSPSFNSAPDPGNKRSL
jgi:hypothetical protein